MLNREEKFTYDLVASHIKTGFHYYFKQFNTEFTKVIEINDSSVRESNICGNPLN